MLCLHFLDKSRSIDAERMKLWNKLLVRDGQAQIFTAEEITGEAVPQKEPSKPIAFTSPYRSGLSKLRESVNKPETHLPAEIETSITRAADKARNA